MKEDPESSLVVDNSVAMVWAFEDEVDAYALSVLEAMNDHRAIIPPLFFWEVTNVLLVAARKGRITNEGAKTFLDRLAMMNFDIVPPPTFGTSKDLFDFALAMGLSAYDAQYLLLAQTMGLPLATLDREILSAMTALGIERFEP